VSPHRLSFGHTVKKAGAIAAAHAAGVDLFTTDSIGDLQNIARHAPGALIFDSVRKEAGSPGAINVNEVWSFKVQISNIGHLDMNNVVLHIHGGNGARVSASVEGPWSDTIVSAGLDVPAFRQVVTVRYYFKAPALPMTGVEELVSVHLHDWDAGLATMLAERSERTLTPKGTYSAQVHP
jgi:hypothetical protein